MIRFLADASLHGGIVTGCLRREPAIDFLSAHEATLQGVPDPEVLAFATRQNRILVTSDLRTMPRHFGDFLEANGQCSGVFLVKQRAPLADVIDALVLIWSASNADEWKNRVVEIPHAITASRPALPLRARPRVRILPGVLILASPHWTRFELLLHKRGPLEPLQDLSG